jgi:two-component system, chemotaxis family, protein-glutamate methylesterase/glutaminase
VQDERKVTVVSAHTTQGASTTFKALGALDFIAKPQDAASAHMEEIAEELIHKIKAAAQSDFRVRPWQLPLDFAKLPTKPKRREHREPTRVIAVGISTGGPNTLQYVLSQLPGDFPGSLVIVQHMPEGFTEMFARRLDESCAIEVKEAKYVLGEDVTSETPSSAGGA